MLSSPYLGFFFTPVLPVIGKGLEVFNQFYISYLGISS